MLAEPLTAQSTGSIRGANLAQTSATTLIYITKSPVCTVELASPLAVVQPSELAPQDVTKVTYTCNDPNGFTRRISSENGGALVRGSQQIDYLISQSGTGDLAFSARSLHSLQTDYVPAFPELALGSSGELRVQIPALPRGLLAGQYIDTVTIEITPN